MLLTSLAVMLAGRATAQTLTALHSFTIPSDSPPFVNSDGANPYARLILSGNTLYGTALNGGGSGYGTVFAVDTDGTGFTTLYDFIGGGDGASPQAGLILSGNTLYGTAESGGSGDSGTVFAVDIDGTGFTTIYSFTAGAINGENNLTNNDGVHPVCGLLLSGNTLYGTTSAGGNNGQGTVFKLNIDGTRFTNLYSFTALSAQYGGTNSDGASPSAGLLLSGNTLYGTATSGGVNGYGTVFAVTTNGTGFMTLHNFSYRSDGAYPESDLMLSGNTLYGTAHSGGSGDSGTVFAVDIDGTGFAALYGFTPPSGGGYFPTAGLILSGNTLYGTALSGGSSGYGTVFAVDTDGTGFTVLHAFTAETWNSATSSYINSDGASPSAGLVLSANTLYGTAQVGGSSGAGTVFSLSLGTVTITLPRLTIIRSGTNVVLTWPANATGFALQSTTNLVSPAVWSAVSPAPVVVNTNNAVTNTISGTRKFYRLSQ